MNICYFGNDLLYKCLEILIEKNCNVTNVFTYNTDNMYIFNTYIKKIATDNNIEIKYDKPSKDDIKNLFYKKKCDLFVSAGYPYKIPIIEEPKFKAINIHPSLLPVGRGPWPWPHVILKDQERSGVTIHKLSYEFDQGDILLQRSFLVDKEEDLETLSCKSQMLAAKMIKEFITNSEYFWEHATKQGEGIYWDMPSEKDRTIDCNDSVYQIKKLVRAFGKFNSYAIFDNKYWLVNDVNGWEEEHNYKYGEIVHRTNKEVVMAVKDGFICFRFFEKFRRVII